ncbi:MAG: hypothetical protein HONBIEJF_00202 [Fimbriimonadaceae bacterium]|nr:hypothetical protein [Fimbriimonadaceae bacterium]
MTPNRHGNTITGDHLAMKNLNKISLAAVLTAGAMSSALAANLVSNGSFEDGTLVNGQNPNNDFNSMQVFAGMTNITDWTITAADGNDVHWAQNGNGYGWITPKGSRMIDLSGWSDVNNGAVMSQDFGAVAGQQYRVDFEIGVDSTFTQGGAVSIEAGIGGSSQSTSLSLPIGWTGVYWEHRTMVFTAANNNDVVHFQGLYSPFCIGLDDVSVEAVPEPASMAALATGGAFLSVRRRRAQQQRKPA